MAVACSRIGPTPTMVAGKMDCSMEGENSNSQLVKAIMGHGKMVSYRVLLELCSLMAINIQET